jgi:hypothetical protein
VHERAADDGAVGEGEERCRVTLVEAAADEERRVRRGDARRAQALGAGGGAGAGAGDDEAVGAPAFPGVAGGVVGVEAGGGDGVLDQDVGEDGDVGAELAAQPHRVSWARPSIQPWSVSMAPVCTLTRMNAASHAAARPSAARASLRSTFTPTGRSVVRRTSARTRAMAATVSGGTAPGKKGTSP